MSVTDVIHSPLTALAMTSAEFVAAARRTADVGPHRALAAYRHTLASGQASFIHLPEFAEASARAEHLASRIVLPDCRISHQSSEAGVVKFVTRLGDQHEIESVLIPDKARITLCVSSQVGCRMGCRFCVTGEMGILRDLSASEIVWQVIAARALLGSAVHNVVFMGMGEPLDNLPAVSQALRVMGDQRGLNIPYRHITVSTAGHVDGLRKLSRLGLTNLRLAVSIHAAQDALRTRLMPLNARYPLAALRAALLEFPRGRHGVILIEYTLLRGVNDREEDARALARYLDGIPVRVNVIPYNPGSRMAFTPPDREELDRFCAWLEAEGLFVKRRHPRGRGVMAACGQLGANAATRTRP